MVGVEVKSPESGEMADFGREARQAESAQVEPRTFFAFAATGFYSPQGLIVGLLLLRGHIRFRHGREYVGRTRIGKGVRVGRVATG